MANLVEYKAKNGRPKKIDEKNETEEWSVNVVIKQIEEDC